MHKSIYQDKKTKKWLIHTSIKGKTCTIRGFNSKKEADEKYEVAISDWQRKHNLLVNDNEYDETLDKYLSYRSKLVRQASLNKDITQFKYYSIIFKGNSLKQIYNEARLKIIYTDIVNNKEFTNQKKMRLVLAFREFSKFCYLSQFISQDTYNMVSMVFLPVKEEKKSKETKRCIPISHFNALLNEINKVNDNLFKLAIFVLYSCGLRISELLGLLVSDIDLENKKIKVQRQLQTNGEITTTLKTNNSYRQVPINNELYDYFKNLEQIRQYNLEKCRKSVKNEKISSNNLEKIKIFPYSHTTFKRKLREYEIKANIPLYSCHEFRHTRCFELAKKCENMSDVVYCAKVLGHTTSVYLNTYCSHLDNSLERKFF